MSSGLTLGRLSFSLLVYEIGKQGGREVKKRQNSLGRSVPLPRTYFVRYLQSEGPVSSLFPSPPTYTSRSTLLSFKCTKTKSVFFYKMSHVTTQTTTHPRRNDKNNNDNPKTSDLSPFVPTFQSYVSFFVSKTCCFLVCFPCKPPTGPNLCRRL